jgi:hypothetical protein
MLPNGWENDIAISPNQIEVSFVDVRSDNFNVEERLSNQTLHTLGQIASTIAEQ